MLKTYMICMNIFLKLSSGHTIGYHCKYISTCVTIYKLGYVNCGSTAFKVQKDGCGIPSAARALLGPEGL